MTPISYVPNIQMQPAQYYPNGGIKPGFAANTVDSAPADSLCCGLVQSHRHIATHWELHINAFLAWLAKNGRREVELSELPQDDPKIHFIVELTTKIGQRICGTLAYVGCIKNPIAQGHGRDRFKFYRVTLSFGEEHGFTDLCAFKNYHCKRHGLFVKLNVFRRSMMK